MTKRSFALLVLGWLIVAGAGAQSSESKTTSVDLFSINKKPVAAEEFIYLYRKNHPDKSENFTREKIEEYLDLFVNFKLKVEEARHRGLDTTQAFRKEYGTYREELRKPYLPDTKMMDSLVSLTYRRMKEEVRASHILINLKPEATPEDTLLAYKKIIELRERILKGEDFGTMASTYSEDPSAKINKGDLGYFTAMQMVFPFEQAAYNTPVGSVSMPARTRFGYHLVKVTDKKPSRGEVEISHIMIRTGEGYDNEKAKDLIFDVYDQLQKGVKWEELCKEYSQDPSSKDNGGRLRPFGVGAMSGVPEFEQIAFNLKESGNVSDPFQTQFGWHIIRLESKIPLPSFKDIEASLKNRVSRDERSQISRQALQQKMKKDFDFAENVEIKSKVLSLGDTTLKTGTWAVKPGAVDESRVLFSMQNKNFTVKEFLSYVAQTQKPNTLSSSNYLNQLYDQFVDENLGLLMEEKIKKENPDYSWLLKEYYEGILLFEIMEKEVWNKASEDSTGQLNYFRSHIADYQAKERMKGKIFSSSSKNIVEQLKPLVEKGDSVKIQEFVSAQKVRNETGAFEKSERPVLAKIDWFPGLFTAENNGQFYLIWIKNILPPGPRTFNEARPAVISDYQNYLEKQWLDQLKKKYALKINKKGKQYALRQLVKNDS
jgi:peptidyl-prolyl cis-trans isomerase SurA